MSPAPIRTGLPPAGGAVGGFVARGVGAGVGAGGPRVDVAVGVDVARIGVGVARGVSVGCPRVDVAVGRPPAVAVDLAVDVASDPDGLGPDELAAPEAVDAPVAATSEGATEGLPAGRPVDLVAGPGLAQAHTTMARMPTVANPAAMRRGCARAADWMGNLL